MWILSSFNSHWMNELLVEALHRNFCHNSRASPAVFRDANIRVPCLARRKDLRRGVGMGVWVAFFSFRLVQALFCGVLFFFM